MSSRKTSSSASPVLRQNSQNIGLYLVGAQLVWSGNAPPEQASNGLIHRRVLVRAWSHDARREMRMSRSFVRRSISLGKILRLFRISRAQAKSGCISYTVRMRTIVSAQAITQLFATLVPEVTVTEVTITPEDILVTAFVLMPSASCPHCGAVSTSVHSYYTRQPHDVSLCGQPVRLLLQLVAFAA